MHSLVQERDIVPLVLAATLRISIYRVRNAEFLVEVHVNTTRINYEMLCDLFAHV